MSDIEIRHYSRALDEIYRLRALLAHEALVTEAHLTYKSFPKSRRAFAEGQVERMQRAARGESHAVLAPISMSSYKRALEEAGASQCLSRADWEEEMEP